MTCIGQTWSPFSWQDRAKKPNRFPLRSHDECREIQSIASNIISYTILSHRDPHWLTHEPLSKKLADWLFGVNKWCQILDCPKTPVLLCPKNDRLPNKCQVVIGIGGDHTINDNCKINNDASLVCFLVISKYYLQKMHQLYASTQHNFMYFSNCISYECLHIAELKKLNFDIFLEVFTTYTSYNLC